MRPEDSPAQRLRTLAAVATLGTDRSGGDPLAASTLLTEAAAFGLRARAGWKPRHLTARLPECPPDARPAASTAAMATLARLVAEGDAGLIEEWGALAIAHGRRIDDLTAPLVLDWWSRQPRRSDVVFAALGDRGPWLASLNEAWRKPVAIGEIPADADRRWETGTLADRVALLATVRRNDPPRGLALVASTWQHDGADDRRRLLEGLAEHVSPADEPFLEAALDDRSKIVRRQAAAVLARVPGSRLRERMTSRARGMIGAATVRTGLISRKRRQLVLTPPETFDPAWVRDGVEERPPKGVGSRAWWMTQILASADLDVWTSASGLDPAATLEALKDDDYFASALQALIESAAAAKDPAWIPALVRVLLAATPLDLGAIGGLLAELPGETREPIVLEIVSHEAVRYPERWLLLASFDAPWSATFSLEALRLMSAAGSVADQETYGLGRAFEQVSRSLDPGAAGPFEAVVAALFSDPRPESVNRSLDRVRLRADMHKEFA